MNAPTPRPRARPARTAMVHQDVDACVDAILDQVGKTVVLGLPLGLGKANHIANALFARASADPSINLKILTALTLEKRQALPEIAHRLVDPIIDRLFGGYEELLYAQAVRSGQMPANIEVAEFFLTPGRWLNADLAQQNYISVNYTEAFGLLAQQGINVIGQLVAKRGEGDKARYSFSCNADVTLDELPVAQRRRGSREPLVLAAQVNYELPFMLGPADQPGSAFDHILDSPRYQFQLYAPPREAVSLAQHAMALHVAGLIKDGGALQIGIGALGDAVAWALTLRHAQNGAFRDLYGRVEPDERDEAALAPFQEGLYGVTEMLVPAFLDLWRAGVLRRRAGDGAVAHGGFFIGCKDFYTALREMPDAERELFRMTTVSFTNRLNHEDEDQQRRDRRDARFVNAAMMATVFGDVISDRREDGKVVSGVGGQFDFVAQAHVLEGARAIIALNAVRESGGRAESNIRYAYGACTIPRHLRDIVVSEYGVADLRGRSDRDVACAMIGIADSRFQQDLLTQAKAAGKIEADYRIPAHQRDNTPEALARKLGAARAEGLLPAYPFGTDLDPDEQALVAALERLKAMTASPAQRARAIARASMLRPSSDDERRRLARLGLESPARLQDQIMRRLILLSLRGGEAA
ncbi:MAG TPA: acetyl-CoA hydrolase/transferase C-terminal domain-containing protein [Caulobacteraceae bacterium]|nr:acetyl-CoA hydrolase/transferase C-terminal domain-containing protein [Caulobacteraceae bacterium]